MAAGGSGSRISAAVYGAVAGDGTWLMRTHGTLNAADFVRHIGLARKVGQDPADHGQRAAARVREGTRVPGA